MNGLDIVLVVILAISTLVGLKTGLIKVALTFVGLIIGIVLAGQYYDSLADKLSFAISDPGWAKVAAFAIIFIAVMVVAFIAASFLKRVASMLLLGWVDRVVGALLGLVGGALILGAVLSVLANFTFGGVQEVISRSGVAQLLLDYFPLVRGLLPEDLNTLRDFFQ